MAKSKGRTQKKKRRGMTTLRKTVLEAVIAGSGSSASSVVGVDEVFARTLDGLATKHHIPIELVALNDVEVVGTLEELLEDGYVLEVTDNISDGEEGERYFLPALFPD